MFLPFTIPTKLMYILSCGNDSLESNKQGQPNILFTILVDIDDVKKLVVHPYIIESDNAEKY